MYHSMWADQSVCTNLLILSFSLHSCTCAHLLSSQVLVAQRKGNDLCFYCTSGAHYWGKHKIDNLQCRVSMSM